MVMERVETAAASVEQRRHGHTRAGLVRCEQSGLRSVIGSICRLLPVGVDPGAQMSAKRHVLVERASANALRC